MPQDNDNTLEKKGFFDNALDYLKNFGTRMLVHGVALVCAGVIADSSAGSYVFLGTYIGIVCLVAREIGFNLKGMMPTSLGLVQMLICIGLGMPLYQSIFWGGFQTFMQRMFAKKFNLGFEWVAALFLFPVALDGLLTSYNFLFLALSLVGIGLGGALFWQIFNNKSKKISQKPEKTVNQTKNASDTTEIIKDVNPYKSYEESISKLRIKQILLPKHMQNNVQALATSAEAIILCMKQDARDQDTGKRFLNRYLPATHSVLDKYQRHCKDAKTNTQVANALSQSEDILMRLEKAFANEHSHLQRNNIDDFSADLNVLDTLLKMEGR